MLLAYERRCLAAIFESALPSGACESMPLGAADVALDRFVEDLFRHAPGHFRLGLRACLWLVTFAPTFVLGRFATFVGLSREDRVRLLEALGRSSMYVVREMPLLFKTVACLGFCGLPEVQAGLGISPVDSSPPEWARRGLPVAKRVS
jgi:hypothetical protein